MTPRVFLLVSAFTGLIFLLSAYAAWRHKLSRPLAVGILALAAMSGALLAWTHYTPRIPTAKLDTKGITPTAAFAKPYELRPDHDWFTSHTPEWQQALASFKGKPNIQYLEVGLYEGRSFFWVLENILTDPTSRLTGIDPFFDEHYVSAGQKKTYKDVFYANVKTSGAAHRLNIIEGFSQIELRKLPLNSFDIIYIDGSHNSRDVLEDAILSWRLLKDDGVLIFDDYEKHAGMKKALDTFFGFYREDVQLVHRGWQLMLRKRPGDQLSSRPWI